MSAEPRLAKQATATADVIATGLAAHRECLARIARFLTRDPSHADDLVQDTCRRALEARAFFASGTNLKAWLICILRNLHVDRARIVCREVPFDSTVEAVAAVSTVAATDDLPPCPAWRRVSDQEITTAVASIPLRYRRTYRLFAVDGLSYLEIAARTGVPSGTVATRIRRARLWLRRRLGGDASARTRPMVHRRDRAARARAVRR